MPKSFCFALLALGMAFFLLPAHKIQAQKFAYVDSKYILENMPEYKAASMQLNNISIRWQSEIDAKIAGLKTKRDAYEAEKVLLTDEMRAQKETQLDEWQNEILELQRKRFGPKGDLFQKQAELIQPIQDKVYQTIQTYAENKNYGMIFDKAGSTTIMYGNDRFDISDNILLEMGIEPGQNNEPDDIDEPGSGNGVIQNTRDDAKDMLRKP